MPLPTNIVGGEGANYTPEQHADHHNEIHEDINDIFIDDDRTALGVDAEATTERSTVMGNLAGSGNTGLRQTAYGLESGIGNSADRVVQMGYLAGRNNSGEWQTAVGYRAGDGNSGEHHTVMGYQAGLDNSAERCTQMGRQAGGDNTGVRQVAIGHRAGEDNEGHKETCLGYRAGGRQSGDRGVFIGVYAGDQNTRHDRFIVTTPYWQIPESGDSQYDDPLIDGRFWNGTDPDDFDYVRGLKVNGLLETRDGLLLISPNGTRYRVTIDNSGNLQTDSTTDEITPSPAEPTPSPGETGAPPVWP